MTWRRRGSAGVVWFAARPCQWSDVQVGDVTERGLGGDSWFGELRPVQGGGV